MKSNSHLQIANSYMIAPHGSFTFYLVYERNDGKVLLHYQGARNQIVEINHDSSGSELNIYQQVIGKI